MQNKPRTQTMWRYRSQKTGSELVWICNKTLYYGDQWVMGSHQMSIEARPLRATTLDEAKAEAFHYCIELLEERLARYRFHAANVLANPPSDE